MSLVSTAPTCARTQCERNARSVAKFINIMLKLGFTVILLISGIFGSNLCLKSHISTKYTLGECLKQYYKGSVLGFYFLF
ncbi:hypothetical protein D3C85_1644810 [compost metagenome]